MSRPTTALACLTAALLLLVVVVQTTVVGRLVLPGGTPDLVLLATVALALAAGSTPGMVTGFAGGLLADAVSGQPLGSSALVLCVIGYLCGLAHREVAGSALWPMVAVGLAAVCTPLAEAAVLGIVGDASLRWSTVLADLPTTVVYTVLLAPFVIAPVARLHRLAHPVRRPRGALSVRVPR